MNPEEYKGTEWAQLLKCFDGKQLKKSLKGAYRKEGNKVRKIVVSKLQSSGIDDSNGLDKGIRTYVYSRGGGFMVTVKPGKSNKHSMYVNKRGIKKPVLLFASEGTKERKTKSKTRIFVRLRKGHATGKMPAYRFIDSATAESFKLVEDNLSKELENNVNSTAQKAGLI